MAITVIRLLEVNDQKVNTVEFKSFKDLDDYASKKSGVFSKGQVRTIKSIGSKKKK